MDDVYWRGKINQIATNNCLSPIEAITFLHAINLWIQSRKSLTPDFLAFLNTLPVSKDESTVHIQTAFEEFLQEYTAIQLWKMQLGTA